MFFFRGNALDKCGNACMQKFTHSAGYKIPSTRISQRVLRSFGRTFPKEFYRALFQFGYLCTVSLLLSVSFCFFLTSKVCFIFRARRTMDDADIIFQICQPWLAAARVKLLFPFHFSSKPLFISVRYFLSASSLFLSAFTALVLRLLPFEFVRVGVKNIFLVQHLCVTFSVHCNRRRFSNSEFSVRTHPTQVISTTKT